MQVQFQQLQICKSKDHRESNCLDQIPAHVWCKNEGRSHSANIKSSVLPLLKSQITNVFRALKCLHKFMTRLLCKFAYSMHHHFLRVNIAYTIALACLNHASVPCHSILLHCVHALPDRLLCTSQILCAGLPMRVFCMNRARASECCVVQISSLIVFCPRLAEFFSIRSIVSAFHDIQRCNFWFASSVTLECILFKIRR